MDQSAPDDHIAAKPAKRVLWVGYGCVGLISLVLLALLGRVAQLQSNPSPRIAERVNTQTSTHQVSARRGAILDRHGRPLAVTRMGHRLFVDPGLIRDRNTFSEEVGYSLGYEPANVEKRIDKRSQTRYVVIDRLLNPDRYRESQALNLAGLATQPVLVREYPNKSSAGQLLGFVGAEGDGLAGIEMGWNGRLNGLPGRFQVVRNAARRSLWIKPETYRPNQMGQSLRLSLDLRIQSIAAEQLAQTIDKFGAESGQIVVMDPKTGEILAMANWPTFDPNHFADAPKQQRRNRAVTDTFEPGSIFKPIIWSALTERGVARPKEIIDCTNSAVWYTDYGRRLRDAHGKGKITWNKVLIESSNIGMAKVAARVKVEKLHTIVRRFGFGQSTESGLPGEVGGIVNPVERWNEYSQSSIPMGQEIGVTALQMVRAFSVFANGGYLVRPTVGYLAGRAYAQRIGEQKRVLSPAMADHTRRVLRRVVSEGTGRHAKSDLYALFGKTGTAQLPDFEHGGYYQDQYVSSFVGGAPTNNPRLIVGCFIRKPDKSKGHYGGTVAAPAVKRVLEKSLQYLGVPMIEMQK